MAATVAQSQQALPSGGGGLHPLQAKGLMAANGGQQNGQDRQQQQQQRQQQLQQLQQQQDGNEEPFDLNSPNLSAKDFLRVRTLGTGTVPRPSGHHVAGLSRLTLGA